VLRLTIHGPVAVTGAQEKFDDMLGRLIWPRLKAVDFKRSKGNFHRPVGRNWEVVNFQKSAYSDRDEISFTVNLGVGIDRLRDGRQTWDEGKRPAITRCQVQERLGMLLSDEQQDVWWTVGSDTDTEVLADAVLEALWRYGLPWLERRSSEGVES
jgi:hypothetical protein